MEKGETGITEFVPLSFIAREAPMVKKSLVPGIRTNITREDVLSMYAVARLMLHSSYAGEARTAACAGVPVQRSTKSQSLRVFEEEPSEPEPSWDGERFGSYPSLIASPEFRFKERRSA